jgi:hypothetical protein
MRLHSRILMFAALLALFAAAPGPVAADAPADLPKQQAPACTWAPGSTQAGAEAQEPVEMAPAVSVLLASFSAQSWPCQPIGLAARIECTTQDEQSCWCACYAGTGMPALCVEQCCDPEICTTCDP